MKKRVLTLTLAGVTMLCLCACSTKENKSTKETPVASSQEAQKKNETFTLVASSPEETYESISYTFLKNGSIRITDIVPKSDCDELIIPGQIDGHPVKQVGYPYLEDDGDPKVLSDTLVKKLTFGEGIEMIGANAFQGAHIEEIVLPEDIKEVDFWAFEGIKELKKLTIKNPDISFDNCVFAQTGLEEIIFPDKMTYKESMGISCFSGIPIKKLVLPELPDGVGRYWFSDCTNLEEITFCENAENIHIATDMFLRSGGPATLTFPERIKQVSYHGGITAENFERNTHTLIFEGKDTELIGPFEKKKFLTVQKVIASEGSKALEYAKEALRIRKLTGSVAKEADHDESALWYDFLDETLNEKDGWRFADMKWEAK